MATQLKPRANDPAIREIEAGVFKVPSSRNSRVSHTTRINPDGTMSCSCQWGLTGYRRTGKPCRHMTAVRALRLTTAPAAECDPFAGDESEVSQPMTRDDERIIRNYAPMFTGSYDLEEWGNEDAPLTLDLSRRCAADDWSEDDGNIVLEARPAKAAATVPMSEWIALEESFGRWIS